MLFSNYTKKNLVYINNKHFKSPKYDRLTCNLLENNLISSLFAHETSALYPAGGKEMYKLIIVFIKYVFTVCLTTNYKGKHKSRLNVLKAIKLFKMV